MGDIDEVLRLQAELMAELFDSTPEECLAAMRSVLSGEVEPTRLVGVAGGSRVLLWRVRLWWNRQVCRRRGHDWRIDFDLAQCDRCHVWRGAQDADVAETS